MIAPGAARGLVLAGLILSAGPDGGFASSAFRSAAVVLTGRAFALSLARMTEGRTARGWWFRIACAWSISFAPILPAVGGQTIRAMAVAAGGVMLLRGATARLYALIGASLLLGSVWLPALTPRTGWAGTIELVAGAAWPTGWHGVAHTIGLFLLGATLALLRIAEPAAVMHRTPSTVTKAFVVLGRMPLTVLIMHDVGIRSLEAAGLRTTESMIGRVPVAGVLLLALVFIASEWLRRHEHGPAEMAVRRLGQVGLGLRAGLNVRMRAVGESRRFGPGS